MPDADPSVLMPRLHPTQARAIRLRLQRLVRDASPLAGAAAEGAGPRGATPETTTRTARAWCGSVVTSATRVGVSWAKSASTTREMRASASAWGW